MNSQRFVILLVAALLVVSGGLYLSTRRGAVQVQAQHGSLYPALGAQLGSISALSVRKGSATPNVTLHKKGEDWSVVQRADYPADVQKLRKLLLSISDAKIVEPKTSDPANFPIIGLEDPSSAGAAGTQIDFTAKDGAHSLIVGKSAGEGNFVRRVGENQSYSVAPSIFVETEPKFWIEAKLIDIPVANIQRIEFKPATGPSYAVHRLAAPKHDKSTAAEAASAAKPAAPEPPPAEPAFALDGIPAGRKAANAESLAPSPNSFSGLTADDVAQAADVDFSKPTTATLTMADGGVITLTGVVLADKHWIQFAGVKDAAFAAKSAGRAYEVAAYRYDGIFRPLEQMLVPKDVPAAAKPTSPKPSKSAPKPAASP